MKTFKLSFFGCCTASHGSLPSSTDNNYKSLITSQKFLSLLGMTGNVIKHVQILCGLLAK